jgi:hypothetical protein
MSDPGTVQMAELRRVLEIELVLAGKSPSRDIGL